MPSTRLPKVLVVDDHAIVRLGVRQLLAGRAELVEADGVAAARRALAAGDVDLLLLDLSLGEDFGLAALPRLRAEHPRLRIVVLTSLAEDLYAERSLRAGADGFVSKAALADALCEAVDSVLAGQVWVSPALRSTLLRRAVGGAAADAGSGRPALSPRELEVLRLVAAGRSTREIAETLNRSVKTIETHKQALKEKLGVETPAALLRAAVSWFGDERP
ncbi:MAG: response regulator transcription factor [Burkholderiales bacterium]|nr:response regulator transcription factor [Burkholderiales bacterium]